MKKNKNMIIILIVIVSIALVWMIGSFLLDTTGIINQGSFRANDAVIKSVVEVKEIQETEEAKEGLSDMKLNLSQKNKISLLIARDIEASRIYIDNISSVVPNKAGKVSLYQEGQDALEITSEMKKEVEIYPVDHDGQYLVEINVDNVDFIEDAKIPDGVNAVTFDGTMLNVLDIKISDIQFEVKFNLNIIDHTGKLNVCKIKTKIPNDELSNSGISIIREDLSKYNFSVKNKNTIFK